MKEYIKNEVCFLIDKFVKKHSDITQIMTMSDKAGVCDCLNLISEIFIKQFRIHEISMLKTL